MRVSRISEVLDLAMVARNQGMTFNPMFISEAGIGKSEAVQQWVAKQREEDPSFGFIDLRLAYLEPPDFIGTYFEYEDEDGVKRTGHALPYFWPTKGRGVLFLEELNRGNTMIMNAVMQITTTRGVGPKYVLPEGWIIASAVNPEGSKYDVNSMDTALADRFEKFNIDYDPQTFFNYVESSKWHHKVVNFLKGGNWIYKTPDALGKDGSYISPRTWHKIHVAEMAGASDGPSKQDLHRTICLSVLGKHIGGEYWKFCWDDAPIMASDLIKHKEKALMKIAQQAKSGDEYAGDRLSMTVESIIKEYGGWFDGCNKEKDESLIDEPTMVAVASIIPSDMAVNLIKGCGYKVDDQVTQFFKGFMKRNPQCIEVMKDNIKIERTMKK